MMQYGWDKKEIIETRKIYYNLEIVEIIMKLENTITYYLRF